MREREWGGSGSYAVPLKPRTYIAIRSNHIQSVSNQCPIRVQSEMYISQSTPTIEAETRQLP